MRKRLKKGFVAFVNILYKSTYLLCKLFVKTNKSSLNNTMLYICQAAETKSKYVSYQIKPKNTAEIPILDGLNQAHSFAIVIQGPICTKDEMTINSVLFYKKVYPFATIIVSTWNDESQIQINQLTKLGAIVVTSEKPKDSGFYNVNYQLLNSLAGVKKAKELGCEFAVKTRSDQRICKAYIFDAMLSTLKMFPGAERQKGRLVVLGVNRGGMFIPFHTCDFLYLGYTEDLIQLFSAPFDTRINDDNIRRNYLFLTRRQISEQNYPPEIYILKHYCNDILGYHCEDTLESYWYVVKNFLICYGIKDVDLMWNKYTRLYDLNFQSASYYEDEDSPKRLSTMCFDFFNWLNLYMGNIRYEASYEKYIDEELQVPNEKKNP